MAKIEQNHYVLAVHDLEGSAKLFEGLGFQVVNEPPGWIFVQRDNCMVMLGECAGAIPASELGDHSYFAYLFMDNVDDYYEELRSRQVQIKSPIQTKPWGLREFSVASPEGHRITIGSRPKNAGG